MIYFIRHAQSLANKIDAELTLKYGKQLFKETQQYLEYKFSPLYFDVEITQSGIQQAMKARELMKDVEIDAVLVSPLLRTLKTCNIIFEGHKSKPQIFVQPYFRTILESSNDIATKISQARQLYPHFNFDRVKEDEAWYIHTLYEPDRSNILNRLQNYKGKERQEKAYEYLLPIMRQNWFARRSNPDKDSQLQQILLPCRKEQSNIFEGYLKKYNKLAVVSHGECIKRYAGYKIKNCEIFPYSTNHPI